MPQGASHGGNSNGGWAPKSSPQGNSDGKSLSVMNHILQVTFLSTYQNHPKRGWSGSGPEMTLFVINYISRMPLSEQLRICPMAQGTILGVFLVDVS